MKKIFYYILLSAMCILPFSCSLDEESRTEIDKNRFMKNALEAETVLLGVYQYTVITFQPIPWLPAPSV